MNLRGEYIEISSEEEMQKATNWLTSLGYKNEHLNPQINKETFVYLFIGNNKKFHFNNEPEKKHYWKPFSVLYEEGMPRDKEEDLLSKAKRLYPIGTQYKCAAGGDLVHTVESMDWAPAPVDTVYGENGKGCIYKHGKWAEIVHEVKSVEKKEFIPDDNLSSYVGRYLEALVDEPNGGYVKKGEYGLIINYGQANFPSQVGYYCSEALKKNNLNIRYRLMPEGFTPLVKEKEEWKPKVGDWVVTDNLSNGRGGMYGGNLGQVWQIGKIIGDWYSPVESMKFTGGSLELHNLRKVTISEINYVDKKEELLEQAKKKYPVGTRYKSAGYSKQVYVVEEQTFQYTSDGDIHGETCKGILYREGKWAEIIEPPKAEVLTSNQTTYQPIVTSYSYNGVKETHQSINKRSKFSTIKAELIKVKQLKIKK